MIGYYVHHVGRGHLRHAECIAAALGEPVTVLSSLARPPTWRGGWVELPRDDLGDRAVDPTAHGQLHWVPQGDDGLRGRLARIASWIDTARPAAVVVDVSVEVTVFIRLLGVPIVVMALPGTRDDPAHQLAYSIADAILAPWPPGMVALDLSLARWLGRTVHVGGISRFAGRARPAADGGRATRVLVLEGAGGSTRSAAELRAAAAATPGHTWQRLGPGAWVDDPWEVICRADVVVSHAGLGALGDVAQARRPAIVVPQPRPHDEQLVTAAALREAKLAITAARWPAPREWPGHLAAARELGGDAWQRWCGPDGGAARAAAVITRVAQRPATVQRPCA